MEQSPSYRGDHDRSSTDCLKSLDIEVAAWPEQFWPRFLGSAPLIAHNPKLVRTLTVGRAALSAALLRPAWWLAGLLVLAAVEFGRRQLSHGGAFRPHQEFAAFVPACAAWTAVGWTASLRSTEWLASHLSRVGRWTARAATTTAAVMLTCTALVAVSEPSQRTEAMILVATLAPALGCGVALVFELDVGSAVRPFLVAALVWLLPATLSLGNSHGGPGATDVSGSSGGPPFADSSVFRWVDIAPFGALLLGGLLLRRAPPPR